jgi:hypothetical protein
MTTTTEYQKAMNSLVSNILGKRVTYSYTCPECEQTFLDPEEVNYGHDCCEA